MVGTIFKLFLIRLKKMVEESLFQRHFTQTKVDTLRPSLTLKEIKLAFILKIKETKKKQTHYARFAKKMVCCSVSAEPRCLYHLDFRTSPKNNDQILDGILPNDNNWPPPYRHSVKRGKLFFLSVII